MAAYLVMVIKKIFFMMFFYFTKTFKILSDHMFNLKFLVNFPLLRLKIKKGCALETLAEKKITANCVLLKWVTTSTWRGGDFLLINSV